MERKPISRSPMVLSHHLAMDLKVKQTQLLTDQSALLYLVLLIFIHIYGNQDEKMLKPYSAEVELEQKVASPHFRLWRTLHLLPTRPVLLNRSIGWVKKPVY